MYHKYGTDHCQIVAVYSVSNKKLRPRNRRHPNKVTQSNKLIRIVTDYGAGLYKPTCNIIGGLIKVLSYDNSFDYIVLDTGNIYKIIIKHTTQSNKNAFLCDDITSTATNTVVRIGQRKILLNTLFKATLSKVFNDDNK